MVRCRVENLKKIFLSSLTPVLPENLIKSSVHYNPTTEQLNILGYKHNLKNKNVYLIGTGKAVKSMGQEVQNIFQSKLESGILSVPVGSMKNDVHKSSIAYLEGAKNNLPDKNAMNTSLKIKSLISSFTENDVVLVLISGGGSALLPLPKEPITLDEKINLITKLANAGADIKELNIVRKRISALKGGQLALQAQPAKVISLILSDIVGDPLDLIASGPTVENKDKKGAALDIINKYNLYNELPTSIKQILLQDEDEKTFSHDNVQNIIIGSNKLSIESAKVEARNLGYFPVALSNIITGNIKFIAKEYIKLTKLFSDYLINKIDYNTLLQGLKLINLPINCESIQEINDSNVEICLILGGETTVEVKGFGVGGRNQELALEFSKLLKENENLFDKCGVHFLSAGTDGIDGPTDAAGALGYLNLIADSKKDNLDVAIYLKNNDSYNFYKKFKNGAFHIKTGHTNTNVMDIHLILITKVK